MLNTLLTGTVFSFVVAPSPDPKWNPEISRVIIVSHADDGEDILSEQVWFKPDETVQAFQQTFYTGVTNHTRVTYRRGCRPDNKEDWERHIGLRLQEMV